MHEIWVLSIEQTAQHIRTTFNSIPENSTAPCPQPTTSGFFLRGYGLIYSYIPPSEPFRTELKPSLFNDNNTSISCWWGRTDSKAGRYNM